MRRFLTALALGVVVQWGQVPGTMSDGTVLERGVVQAGRCGAFEEIVALPYTTTFFVDETAVPGFRCYRARNYNTVDLGDGTPAVKKYSIYSNIDVTKPGNPSGLKVLEGL